MPATDDAVVDVTYFSDAMVDIVLSPGVLPTNALDGNSVLIGYNRQGRRQLASDQTGSGFSAITDATVNSTGLVLTVRPHLSTESERTVTVPVANGPTAN